MYGSAVGAVACGGWPPPEWGSAQRYVAAGAGRRAIYAHHPSDSDWQKTRFAEVVPGGGIQPKYFSAGELPKCLPRKRTKVPPPPPHLQPMAWPASTRRLVLSGGGKSQNPLQTIVKQYNPLLFGSKRTHSGLQKHSNHYKPCNSLILWTKRTSSRLQKHSKPYKTLYFHDVLG